MDCGSASLQEFSSPRGAVRCAAVTLEGGLRTLRGRDQVEKRVTLSGDNLIVTSLPPESVLLLAVTHREDEKPLSAGTNFVGFCS